jgi:hypothetical protein
MERADHYGIWFIGELHEYVKDAPSIPASLDGKDVYCPLCKSRMRMGNEGSVLLNIYHA